MPALMWLFGTGALAHHYRFCSAFQLLNRAFGSGQSNPVVLLYQAVGDPVFEPVVQG